MNTTRSFHGPTIEQLRHELQLRQLESRIDIPVARAESRDSLRDHSVAESFAYLNALQPAIFDIEEIKRNLQKPRT